MKKIKISGRVISGNKIGGKIGIPTINIEGDFDLPYGIYGSSVSTSKGEYTGALYYGPRRSSFGKGDPIMEIHLLDFSGDLYGETVKIDVYNKVRDAMEFKDLDSLKEQIQKDISIIRKQHAQISKK